MRRAAFCGLVSLGVLSVSDASELPIYWHDWLDACTGINPNSNSHNDTALVESRAKILMEIMGPLRPHSSSDDPIVSQGNPSWQKGGVRDLLTPRGAFSFIAWNFNTYPERPKGKPRLIQVTPWPHTQKEVHEQLMMYIQDNGVKPAIRYFDPRGTVKNGGVVYQWTEGDDPKVTVRIHEVSGIQTTISFFRPDDYSITNFRYLERYLKVGERPVFETGEGSMAPVNPDDLR
ncbi:hypothetical protein BH09VER1_BH09VER1_26540 [soil metagenome]